MTTAKKVLLSILHAVWLLALTWFWLNGFQVLDDEQALIKLTSEVKRNLLKVASDIPNPEQLLFINVDHDLELVPLDTNEPKRLFGEEVITNRQLLADFFGLLNQFPDTYQYVVCDIFFDKKWVSKADATLESEISKVKRIIVPAHLEKGKILKPKFTVPYALADYQSVKGAFYKWQLLENDQFKTLPLALYEKLHHKEMTKSWGFFWMDGKPCFNRMITDLKILQPMISDPKILQRRLKKKKVISSFKSLEDLKQIHSLLPEKFENIIRDKIIVIGAFERDAHDTVLGKMGGTLIMINVYLSLVLGQHYISFGMIFFLLLVYTVISYHIFYKIPVKLPEWLEEFLSYKPVEFIGKYFSILGILLLASIICYIFFEAHINILFITLYIHAVKEIHERRSKKIGDVEASLEMAGSAADPATQKYK